MTRLLLNICDHPVWQCTVWHCHDRFCTPAFIICTMLSICQHFTVSLHLYGPHRINKTIYTGPSAAIRTYLPASFCPRTHMSCCLLNPVFAARGKTIWDYRKCMRLIRKSSIDEDNLIETVPSDIPHMRNHKAVPAG